MAYQSGDGVSVDHERAVHYFRLAAEQGSINARYMLASCYKGGLGVPQSDMEAVKHLRISAAAGDEDSQILLAEYLAGFAGEGIEPEYEEAVRLLNSIKENSKDAENLSKARFYFSVLQWNGQGTERDIGKALSNLKKSVNLGCKEARDFLDDMNLECCYCKGKGRVKLCNKCKLVSYCSVECQKLDWKKWHRKYCRPYLELVAEFERETNYEKLIDKAKQYSKSGNLAEAEKVLLQAAEINPEMPDAYGLLGKVAHDKGDLEGSVNMMSKGTL
jgi:TPR repeat protein